MPIIDLSPLDSEGIRLNRPASEVKWTKLTNATFRDGAIVPRPGFKEFADLNEAFSWPAVSPGAILGITEVFNPGSSITGRESWTIATEQLRPDGSSDIVAGWTGDHLNIDEDPPDGAAAIVSSTEGSQKAITFGNPSTTFATVLGIRIHGRARNSQSGGQSSLKFYSRPATTNFAIGSVIITASEDTETDWWQDYSIFQAINPADSERFIQGDLNALQLVAEFESGTKAAFEWLPLDGDGTDTDFTQWDEGNGSGAATYTEFDGDTWTALDQAADDLGAITTTANDKQGWTMSGAFNTTFTTITSLSFFIWVKTFAAQEHSFKLIYKNSGGTEFDVETVSFGTATGRRIFQHVINSTTNPDTAVAWVEADITGGEFIIENLNGTSFVLMSVTPLVEGDISGQELQVDTVCVEIQGVTSTLPGNGLLTPRLFSGAPYHIRVDDEVGPSATLTNVTNSANLSSSPAIWGYDHTVLYGQVYIVNGIDNTARYPDSSDLFEALSTNNADGATPLTGRTVAAFADRILYGWVKDNATVTPERVSYSKIFDGGTHLDGTAGDFDLLDTPGGVVKLLTLNEDVCFAGKEVGIYALRRSGRDIAPIFRDVIDFETRCVSRGSCQRILNERGDPIILFLGWNPATGYNIFAFDGSSVVAVGDAISSALREDANHEMLQFSIAGVEPLSGAYWIGFAEGTDIGINSGYAFHMRTGAWTRWELPWDVTAFGTWTVASDPSILSANDTIIAGEPRLIAGTAHSIPMVSSSKFIADSLGPPTQDSITNAGGDVDRFVNDDNLGTFGRKLDHIDVTLETGDIDLTTEAGELQTVEYRVRMELEVKAPIRVRIDASEDGGQNWNATTTHYIGGTVNDKNEISHEILDLTTVNAYRVRTRIRIGPENDNLGEQDFAINKLKIEWQPGGGDG